MKILKHIFVVTFPPLNLILKLDEADEKMEEAQLWLDSPVNKFLMYGTTGAVLFYFLKKNKII